MHISALLGFSCAVALVAGGCAAKTQPAADATTPAPTTSTAATSTPPSSAATSAPATSAATSAPATSAPTAPAVRTITITVRGRKIVPAPSSVSIKKGQTLRVVVTTAADDILHAHGFGVEKPLLAGKPTTADLVGAEPGTYEVETHEPALLLLLVRVR